MIYCQEKARMSSNDKLDKIETSIAKLDERLDKIDVVLVRNTATLEEHIRRTDILETYVQDRDEKVDAELVPIRNHVNAVTSGAKGILFFCSALASIAGFIYLLKQLSLF